MPNLTTDSLFLKQSYHISLSLDAVEFLWYYKTSTNSVKVMPCKEVVL